MILVKYTFTAGVDNYIEWDQRYPELWNLVRIFYTIFRRIFGEFWAIKYSWKVHRLMCKLPDFIALYQSHFEVSDCLKAKKNTCQGFHVTLICSNNDGRYIEPNILGVSAWTVQNSVFWWSHMSKKYFLTYKSRSI